MSNELAGKTIAFLATDGVEQVELTRPWEELHNAGAEVALIFLKPGAIQGFNHLEAANTFPVDKAVADARAEDYQGLVLPGGVANPDALRQNEHAVAFVKAFIEQGKPVSVICHGPWTLIEAGVVAGRKLTSWPSLRTDLCNAGADWVDEEVCVDGSLVSSRKPDDIWMRFAKRLSRFYRGQIATEDRAV